MRHLSLHNGWQVLNRIPPMGNELEFEDHAKTKRPDGSLVQWPIPSVELILMVNVGRYTIHGSYGWCFKLKQANHQTSQNSWKVPSERNIYALET